MTSTMQKCYPSEVLPQNGSLISISDALLLHLLQTDRRRSSLLGRRKMQKCHPKVVLPQLQNDRKQPLLSTACPKGEVICSCC
jgi:hypothetical protein